MAKSVAAMATAVGAWRLAHRDIGSFDPQKRHRLLPKWPVLALEPTRCAVITADEQLVLDVLHFDLVDQEVRALAVARLNSLDGSRRWALIAGTGVVVAIGPTALLYGLGFKGAGIAAGSWAASWQGAAISSGSWFSWAQSAAATGAICPKLGVLSSAAAWLGFQDGSFKEMTDRDLLLRLVEKELIDYEVRNVLKRKLESGKRM